MKPEYVEDMVREGDVVVVRTVVLEVMGGGAIRTAQVHPPSHIRAHERVFRAGDLVRNKGGAGGDRAVWQIICVHNDSAWIQQSPYVTGNRGFIWPTDDLVHAIPEIVVDKSETF